jgi:hypothetical protein
MPARPDPQHGNTDMLFQEKVDWLVPDLVQSVNVKAVVESRLLLLFTANRHHAVKIELAPVAVHIQQMPNQNTALSVIPKSRHLIYLN